jgi:thymidylate kinase
MDTIISDIVPTLDIRSAPSPPFIVLLNAFHRHAIAYCYWKSSGRVHKALCGDSDLDLLIAKQDQYRAQKIILDCGFKLFPSTACMEHPSISSYLGYDEAKGRLVHLHICVRLAIGESLLKNYVLPWEGTLLARAVYHQNFPIRVLDAASEALLIIVRFCLELRRSDPVVLRHWRAAESKYHQTIREIPQQIDRRLLRERAGDVFTGTLADMIADAAFDDAPVERLRSLRWRIRRELGVWRTYNAVEAGLRGISRVAAWSIGKINDRALHQSRPWRRRAPGGGCVVAVLGVDGSGKTTVVSAVRAWLGAEVDTVSIYFGTGDGRPSFVLLPFKLLASVIRSVLRTKPKGASHGRISGNAPSITYSALLMIWAFVLSVEKRLKLIAARRGADRGLVVVTDRYPQDEYPEYNDGPLLGRLNWAPPWLREFERKAYALARRLPPDLVIKLEVTEATAAKREPDMDPETVRRRIELVRRLAFADARVVRVDAEQPLECVLGQVKREVWNML